MLPRLTILLVGLALPFAVIRSESSNGIGMVEGDRMLKILSAASDKMCMPIRETDEDLSRSQEIRKRLGLNESTSDLLGKIIKGEFSFDNTEWGCSKLRCRPDVEIEEFWENWLYKMESTALCYLSGDYSVDGEVGDHHVSGSGRFKFEVGPILRFGDIKLYETPEKAIKVESLGCSAGMSFVEFDVEGLTVEGKSLSDFKTLVGVIVLTIFNHKQELCPCESFIIEELNNDIGNKTFEDVMRSLGEPDQDKYEMLLEKYRDLEEYVREEEEKMRLSEENDYDLEEDGIALEEEERNGDGEAEQIDAKQKV